MVETKTAAPAIEGKTPGARALSYVDAGIEALREEMRRDPMIFYIGQGIGVRGGNWQQTRGLWRSSEMQG